MDKFCESPTLQRSQTVIGNLRKDHEQTVLAFDEKVESLVTDATAQIARILLSNHAEESYNDSFYNLKIKDVKELVSDEEGIKHQRLANL